MRHLLHWAAVHFGFDRSAGPSQWYSFWSGFGSDIGELTLIGAVVGMARHKTCHVKGCWRIGHPHEGVVRCRRHPHAATTLTLEQKLLAMEGRLVDLLTVPPPGGPQPGDNS